MALVLADRVKETTTTAGTGTITLAGAATGFQSFAAIGNGNTTYYTIAAQTGTEWEVGIGTYTAAGTTLSRDTVLASSNAGALVNFSAGTKDVFVTQPAERTAYVNGTTATFANNGIVPVVSGGTGLTSFTSGGLVYASSTSALATGSAITTDGTNLINSGSYTAPSNGAGAGTKTLVQGSTGTGQAGATGGNGYIELIGGGGTTTWTSFASTNARRRGGINLQAGTSQADAGGTYVNGSFIDIIGSNGTNNGTSTGAGSRIRIFGGSVTKTDGNTSGGSALILNGGGSSSGGSTTLSSGGFVVASGTNYGASVTFGSATTTTGGDVFLTPGGASASGSTAGKAYVVDPATSTNYEILTTGSTVAVANGGTGATSLAANNVILGNGTSAVQVVAPGTSGNVLTSNGTTWASSTPPASGITYVYKTANYTAQNKEGVLTSTAGGAFTVTLPATPTTGFQVVVADSAGTWGTNNLTVGRNGSTIAGSATDLICNISGASVQLVYDGTTWDVYAQVGGVGGTVVTETGTQTLTNKTISGASNTLTNISLTASVTGTLPAANGGTGLSSPGTSGNVLTSNGTAWTSAAPAVPKVTGSTLYLNLNFGAM